MVESESVDDVPVTSADQITALQAMAEGQPPSPIWIQLRMAIRFLESGKPDVAAALLERGREHAVNEAGEFTAALAAIGAK